MTPKAITYILGELHREKCKNVLINIKSAASINVRSVEDIEFNEEANLLVCQTETGIKRLSVQDIEYISF